MDGLDSVRAAVLRTVFAGLGFVGCRRLVERLWPQLAERWASHENPPSSALVIANNPVLRTALPLLALMARLPRLSAPADSEGLRHRIIAALRRFQSAARTAGIAADQMRSAHFILCAALDDVIGQTPWGRQAGWAERSLISTFHKSIEPGPALTLLLNHIQTDAQRYGPELELACVCIALGFRIRHRADEKGDEALRAVLRERGAPDAALSPSWRGVAARRSPLWILLPPWVLASLAAALLTGVYVLFSFSLGSHADRLHHRMSTLLPDRPAQVIHHEPITSTPSVATDGVPVGSFAASSSAARAVTASTPRPRPGLEALTRGADGAHLEVVAGATGDVIRVSSDTLFVRHGDTLTPTGKRLLERLAQALDHEVGSVLVVGHTDDNAPQSVRFPSALVLSEAHARTVARVLVAHLAAPDRVTIEGRADTEPLVSNRDAASRARNRRIEIILPPPPSLPRSPDSGAPPGMPPGMPR